MLGLSGGIDSALVAYLVAEAIGAEQAAVRADAVPDVVAGVAGRRRGGRAPRSAAPSELVEITPMVDGYFGPAASRAAATRRSPLRRGNFMARMRMAVLYDRSVTWGGLVVGTGNKTEALIGYTTLFGDNACAFNPIGDLYKSQVRQLAAAIGVPDAIIAQGAVGGPVAGPDRRGRGRLQLPDARPPPVLAGRPAALDRRAGRDGLRPARSSSASSGWSPASEFKRQVPPIAKLGPRTAGVDYLYPRRRPGSART